MATNRIGNLFTVTSFGESHGPGIGAVIDGVPAGINIDLEAIKLQLNRRRPGQSHISTTRNETDDFDILSGIYGNKTLGSPVCIWIPNKDQKPEDYENLRNVYRPGHADFTYDTKYGFRDPRGGGRSSARITAAWVAAGSIAEQGLKQRYPDISIIAWVSQVHKVKAGFSNPKNRQEVDLSPVRCHDIKAARLMEEAIIAAKEAGDSLGGVITCIVNGCPAGIGEPVFQKLQARLGEAMLNLNAVKGVSFGTGFNSAEYKGSELNDAFITENGIIKTSTNHSGGIQGGISNGMSIVFQVAFKPTSTIGSSQLTVDDNGKETQLNATGRHDPCVLPRAVPIVEALTAITLFDLAIIQTISRWD